MKDYPSKQAVRECLSSANLGSCFHWFVRIEKPSVYAIARSPSHPPIAMSSPVIGISTNA